MKQQTNRLDKICKENDVALFEVLTGFKNIAAKIKEFEEKNRFEKICKEKLVLVYTLSNT